MADGGAVDSYIWEYLQDHNSEFAAKTRIIQKSPPFGFPPLVSRRGVDAEVVDHLTKVLLEMSDDPDGRVFLDGLKLDGFGEHPADLFDDIRQMANDTRKSLLWIRSAETKPSTEP